MKRYINASWNGIVPIKYIVEKLDISRKEAKEFQNWLYENEYDSGFKSVDELFLTFDIDDLYNEMKGIKEKPSTNKSDKDKEASMRKEINHELSLEGRYSSECIDFKIDNNNEEIIVSLETNDPNWHEHIGTHTSKTQELRIPFDIALDSKGYFNLLAIMPKVLKTVDEMWD